MYKAFIEPDLQHAEIRIFNSFNPFSGLLNPTYSLKSSKSVAEQHLKNLLMSEARVELSEQEKKMVALLGDVKFAQRREKYYG